MSCPELATWREQMDESLKHDARLPGFSGPPLFLKEFVEFREMCRKKFLHDDHLVIAARKIGGLREASSNTRTTDGHRWYCAFTFQHGNSMVAFLFPFFGGSDSPQNVMTPRLPAVYIEGSIDENYIIELLKKFGDAAEEAAREEHQKYVSERRALQATS
jgi:hypothetical protein